MGRNDEICKITWLALMLLGSAFLRVILSDFGSQMDEGFVILTDQEIEARQFITDYCGNAGRNGQRIYKWKREKMQVSNFCCGMLLLNPKKPVEAMEFLEETEFFPVGVTGGIVPAELRCARYIFRATREDTLYMQKEESADSIGKFQTFIISETETVCKVIRSAQNSTALAEYQGRDEYLRLFTSCITIGKVYKSYLEQDTSDGDAERFWKNFLRETYRRIQTIPDFASGEDLCEMVADLVWTYVKQQGNVLLADAEQICGRAFNALEENRLIIYDTEYYYFTTPLFSEIFRPLLQTMSVPELKRCMSDEGILRCNSSDYTVKKQVTTVYGTKERIRVLRMTKEMLMSRDNLFLEDFFDDVEGGRSEIECSM